MHLFRCIHVKARLLQFAQREAASLSQEDLAFLGSLDHCLETVSQDQTIHLYHSCHKVPSPDFPNANVLQESLLTSHSYHPRSDSRNSSSSCSYTYSSS